MDFRAHSAQCSIAFVCVLRLWRTRLACSLSSTHSNHDADAVQDVRDAVAVVGAAGAYSMGSVLSVSMVGAVLTQAR